MTKEIFNEIMKDRDAVLLLDVREAGELLSCATIDGAVHMPMMDVLNVGVAGSLPTDKPIIVFCYSGSRSDMVARELKCRGYQIDGLDGGLVALRNGQ